MGAVGVLALWGASLIEAPHASADATSVTSLADDGTAGTLRAAIAEGVDEITFAVTGTITLSPARGPLEIVQPVTITGPGADELTIDGGFEVGIFEVWDTGGVTIADVTLANGHAADAGGALKICSAGVTLSGVALLDNHARDMWPGGAIFADRSSGLVVEHSTIGAPGHPNFGLEGGGIAYGAAVDVPGCNLPALAALGDGELINPGLSIVDTTIQGNAALGGGGLIVDDVQAVRIEQSSILDNTALQGAGIALFSTYDDAGNWVGNGATTIANTTISGNGAYFDGEVWDFAEWGGGIAHIWHVVTTDFAAAAISEEVPPSLVVLSSTVTRNAASDGGPGIRTSCIGDCSAVADAVTTLENTIVSGNLVPDETTGEPVPTPDAEIAGPYAAQYSLLGLLPPPVPDTNIWDVHDPALGPLAFNGGSTLNHEPMSGSLAVDAGDPAYTGPPFEDQRGFARISDGRIDIGSVELQGFTPPPVVIIPGQQAAFCDPAPEDRFTDVPADNVHEANVDCIAFFGITVGGPEGLPATMYGPGLFESRGQMASYVARMIEAAGFELPLAAPDAFDDDNASTHEVRINQLAAAGIVHGTAARTFDPLAPISREQMATYLAQAWQFIVGTPLPAGVDAFSDDNASVHEAAINQLAAAGIVQGVGGGLYNPAGTVARDQMATFLVNMLRQLNATVGFGS